MLERPFRPPGSLKQGLPFSVPLSGNTALFLCTQVLRDICHTQVSNTEQAWLSRNDTQSVERLSQTESTNAGSCYSRRKEAANPTPGQGTHHHTLTQESPCRQAWLFLAGSGSGGVR